MPRVALKASTFDGLLSYPSVPSKTVFIISIKAAAAKTGSLDYTFGALLPLIAADGAILLIAQQRQILYTCASCCGCRCLLETPGLAPSAHAVQPEHPRF